MRKRRMRRLRVRAVTLRELREARIRRDFSRSMVAVAKLELRRTETVLRNLERQRSRP